MKQHTLLVVLVLLLVISASDFAPVQVKAASIDLNSIMLSEFEEWDAFYNRYLNSSGVLTDPSDYSLKSSGAGSNISTSGLGFYLLALSSIYNSTKEAYQLERLKFWVNIAINDAFYYRTATGVGTIFYSPQYILSGSTESDGAPMNTMALGIVAVHLYKWTGDTTYKTLADRIASETRSLIVVNNATDQAWSCSYYYNRDETNAKLGVNRQTSIAYFYAWYGKEIDSTYSSYVPLVVNWVWHSQLASNGLSYDIGGATASNYYTAFALWMTINAYHLVPSEFSASLKLKLMNSLVYLRDKPHMSGDYMKYVFLAIANMVGLKDSYFNGNVTSNTTKSLAYVVLETMRYSDLEGIVLTPNDYGFGWRWQAYQLGAFFSEYPFSDGTFDAANISGLKFDQTATGIFTPVGWAPVFMCDSIRDGGNNYGVGWVQSTRQVMPVRKEAVAVSTRNMTAYGYYWKVTTTYAGGVSVTQYSYPTAMHVTEVTGANQKFWVNLDYDANWKAILSNGTIVALTGLTNLANYTFTTRYMLWLNSTGAKNKRVIYVETPLTKFTVGLSVGSYIRIYNTTASASWRAITGFLTGVQIPVTTTKTWTYFSNFATTYNVTQPLSFSTMISDYQTRMNEMTTEPTWFDTYKTAYASEPRLISHNPSSTAYLTNWTYSLEQLTFTISASAGYSSNIKIYCGSLQKPKSVSGLSSIDTWTYDEATKIVTITKTHASDATVTIVWTTGSSGVYSVQVTVSANHIPVGSATVSINGQNKTTDLFGRTSWSLPFGDYVIWAYYQGKNQSQAVSVNQDRTLGFNFTITPENSPPPNFTPLLIIALVFVIGFIILSARRRK